MMTIFQVNNITERIKSKEKTTFLYLDKAYYLYIMIITSFFKFWQQPRGGNYDSKY